MARVPKPRPAPGGVEAAFVFQLRIRRHVARLTLRQFGARLQELGCPLDNSALSRTEQGQRHVTLDEAAAIARVLKCELADMLTTKLVVDATGE